MVEVHVEVPQDWTYPYMKDNSSPVYDDDEYNDDDGDDDDDDDDDDDGDVHDDFILYAIFHSC